MTTATGAVTTTATGGDDDDDGGGGLPEVPGLLGAFARFDCGLFAQNFGSASSKFARCQRATQNALLDTALTGEAACAQEGLSRRRREDCAAATTGRACSRSS